MLCGILDRHPQEKSTRRSLAQKMIKCESQLANLQSDYNNKLQAYKSIEDSFARKIETDFFFLLLYLISHKLHKRGGYK